MAFGWIWLELDADFLLVDRQFLVCVDLKMHVAGFGFRCDRRPGLSERSALNIASHDTALASVELPRHSELYPT